MLLLVVDFLIFGVIGCDVGFLCGFEIDEGALLVTCVATNGISFFEIGSISVGGVEGAGGGGGTSIGKSDGGSGGLISNGGNGGGAINSSVGIG